MDGALIASPTAVLEQATARLTPIHSIPAVIFAIEAALVGIFIIAATTYTVILHHPASPVASFVADPLHGRVLMGIATALTAVAVIYSPWGRRSGPLLNPAVVICFLRMGRITRRQAVGFMSAQFAGATAGALAVKLVSLGLVSHPNVRHVVTTPGPSGVLAAWLGEFAIAFILLSAVLMINRRPRLAPFTGCFSAALIAAFIITEAPLSGMSLSPARTFGPALVSSIWTGIWIYFTAPIAGMLLAVEVQRVLTRAPHRLCVKLAHPARDTCIFRCNCRHHSRIDP